MTPKRLAVLDDSIIDLDHTTYLLKEFKTPEAKEAIRKLRYLLILTQHHLKYGEDMQ